MTHPLDIAIIGAGLAGVGGAARLARDLPHKRIALFERRARIGGTWDLFRYPGVRSDSDMYTLGYEAHPWTGERAIADGEDIRRYIEDMAREEDVARLIRFGLTLTRANWSSQERLWTLDFTEEATGRIEQVRARFIYMATGYYDYDRPYRPTFDGEADFAGPIVHPQHWPEALDLAGKRVSIVGSGATAVSLAPALAGQGAKVTLIQRSPSYVVSLPARVGWARLAFRLLPDRLAYRLVRGVERRMAAWFYRFARSRPRAARRFLMRGAAKALDDEALVARHFDPDYDPWTQRLCVAPDGDFFTAIHSGALAMETGHIERFEKAGVRMKTGQIIECDLIVSATGLRVSLFGKAAICVDDMPVKPARETIYKGAMLSGVPNMIFVFGYTNASWTLKADLVAHYAARLIAEMDDKGANVADPGQPPPTMKRLPMTDFSSGYFRRSAAIMPRQGDSGPWALPMDYEADRRRLLKAPIDDGTLRLD